jgi:serine/threonine protein kinase
VDQPLGSRYLLHDLLGRGAMGQVFRGSVRESGDPVAVKVLKPELVSDPEVVARFFQERSILTSISDPNVVRVIDLVVEGETLGIVMELVEGQDLRRYLRERRTLPPAEAVALIGQLLHGVAAVHAAGIIHRDIKPENVLVDVSGGQPCLKVTDFGVARLSYGASLTKLSSLIGTPEYMAPEVADHDTAVPSADLYSAGIVLYEMLSGRTPFAGGHPLAVLRRQVDQPPPPIPGVPPQLWAQIEALLAKDPLSRPGSATQAAAALAPLESSLARLPALPPMAAPAQATVTPSRAATNPGTPAAAVTVPAGQGQDGTVLRHRDRGHIPDPDLPGGSSRMPQPRPKRSGLRSRPVVLALPAALVVLAAAVAAVLVTRPGHTPSGDTPAPSAASYAFAPQQYPDGLLIVRRWTLNGKDGSRLTETITASSATGKALRVPFQEAIPTAIAPTVQTVHFKPAPAKIVQADPVVEWQLRLPAQGTITVSYRAAVSPAGATRTRLARWAKAFTTLEAHLNGPASTDRPSPPHAKPTVTPSSVPTPATSTASPTPGSPSSTPTPGFQPTTVLVHATTPVTVTGGGQSTGLRLVRGQQLSLSATGQIIYGYESTNCTGYPLTDPDGNRTSSVTGLSCGQKFDSNPAMPSPGSPVGSLLWRISDSGWSEAGASTEIVAPEAGTLYLAVNDDTPQDNDRFFTVTLTS